MANKDAGRKRKLSATEDQDRARAAGSRKPGVVGKVMDQARNTVEGVRLPRLDWRTFAWGLLLLLFVIFIARNWAPMRINLFGWYIDAPRAVVLAIFFGLGMVTTWLIEVRGRRARAAEEAQGGGEAEEAHEEELWSDDLDESEVLATEIPAEAFEDESAAEEPVRPQSEALAPDSDEDTEPEGPEFIAVDETEGDALSDEYRFDEPKFDADSGAPADDDDAEDDDEWVYEPDESADAEPAAAGEEADEDSPEADDEEPTSFWRK
ncbi:MAG: hypothetical protein ACOX9R_01375 [Armatimonadota bacterium]